MVARFASTLPFSLDPFQRQAMEALAEGRSVLVAAPTGTGKTVIAEFAVHLALSRGMRAIYTTPLKALSNQKFRDFRDRYGDRVGLYTGDLVVHPRPLKPLEGARDEAEMVRSRVNSSDDLVHVDLVENPAGRLLVMTTEVARNMLVQDPGVFQDVGCLVFDEVHYLADPERGTAWEESILLAPAQVPLVCLSATVANAGEIADWMRSTGREVALIESDHRAVPLKHRYYLEGVLYPILEGEPSQLPALPNADGGKNAGVGTWGRGDAGRWRTRQPALSAQRPGPSTQHSLKRNGNGGRPARAPGNPLELPTEPPEILRALDGADLLPALYFMFSRRAVEGAAEACRRLNLLPYRQAAEVRRLARQRLADLPAEDRTLPQVERLLALLPKGIGFHHAGLLPPLKTLVEELLATGRLKAVFATDTLALGINVPARSVVVGEMIKFDGQARRPLSPGEYRQLTGRAGRRGMDPVGYSILLHSPWVGLDRVLEIATGEVAPLESAFRPGYSTVLNLHRQTGDEDQLAQLIAGSLRQFQDGGMIRSLGHEREELAAALATLPTGCPLDGGPVNWLEQERSLQREQERAESALEAVRREKAALEERLSAWPWRYSKGQKKDWLCAARPGELAYSRRRNWVAYLGPSSEGIGLFLAGGAVVPLAGYAELDYLPEPPIRLELPEGVARRAALLDGAADQMGREEVEQVAATMERLSLPDVEAEASESACRSRTDGAGILASLEERLSAAHERLRAASQLLAHSPCRSCELRAGHRRSERQRRSFGGLLAGAERELEQARAESRRRARRTLGSLRSVLESFGYLASGKPTAKAGVLQRLFDSNGLMIAELLDWGVLADASAADLAEVASWFAFDREGSGRALAATERLARMRAAAEAVAKRVLETERRFGVNLSSPLSPEFRGLALAWVGGASLADLSARSGLAEGDIVFALQKTIDLCRQIGQAAAHSRTPSLARRAAGAERLLRRGVVDSYYRWVVGQEAQGPASRPPQPSP